MKIIASVTIDFDPDAATTANNRQVLEWRGMDLAPELFSILDDFEIRSTCFLRIDDQIKSEKGSYVYLFEEHKLLWKSLVAKGHELGLHPHLYTFCKTTRQFGPDFDPDAACLQLQRIHEATREAGLVPTTIRIGESFHCSPLMNLASNLGYLIDSTAIPGRVRDDGIRRIDWGPTPNCPYFPSTLDYRVPGVERLKLLEVPMTSALFKADYDSEPRLRYCSLTYRPDVFLEGLDWHMRSLDKDKAHSLVFIIHPGEFLASNKTSTSAGLYSFDIMALRTNLQALADLVNSKGEEIVFGPLRELPELLNV